jgi:hypothetical protein
MQKNKKSQEEQAPIQTFNRDENGLIPNIKYELNESGLIDWRKIIDSKYLVPNLSKFPVGTENKDLDVSSLDDSQLLILLGGIKEIANLRGFSSVSYNIHSCSPQYVAVSCKISWIPNLESGGIPVEFESLADAHIDNTKSFARDFLMAIAENRAFVRAVRNFLRINIVGTDELGDGKNQTVIHTESSVEQVAPASHPSNVLKEAMQKSNISFEKIKQTMVKENVEGAEQWSSISDIPNKTIFSLIQRIKKKSGEKN